MLTNEARHALGSKISLTVMQLSPREFQDGMLRKNILVKYRNRFLRMKHRQGTLFNVTTVFKYKLCLNTEKRGETN